MNKVILLGRLRDYPVTRYVNNTARTSFIIVINRYISEGQKEVDYIPIIVWGKQAEIAGNNLSKGQRVLVEGRLQIRFYEGDNGQKHRVAEIVSQNLKFLDKKKAHEDENK